MQLAMILSTFFDKSLISCHCIVSRSHKKYSVGANRLTLLLPVSLPTTGKPKNLLVGRVHREVEVCGSVGKVSSSYLRVHG